MRNNQKSSNRFMIVVRVVLGIVLISVATLWVLSHILKWEWDWGFSEASIVLFTLMGVALLLVPYLAEFSLPGGVGFKLRGDLEEVSDTQTIGEVVFNKEERETRHLYWVDEEGKKRLIPNLDTASLFATQKGFIGISRDRFNRIEEGSDIPSMSKESFRRTKENDMFVVLDEKVFYLSSLSLAFKHGWMGDLDKMELITDEDFRQYQIFR